MATPSCPQAGPGDRQQARHRTVARARLRRRSRERSWAGQSRISMRPACAPRRPRRRRQGVALRSGKLYYRVRQEFSGVDDAQGSACCCASAAASPRTRPRTWCGGCLCSAPGTRGDDRTRQRFVRRADLQALSGQPVPMYCGMPRPRAAMGHPRASRAGRNASSSPRPPANTLAKLAHGFRRRPGLHALPRQHRAPLAVCPAMNHVMWKHPATQANMATLRARGITVIGPTTARWPGESKTGRRRPSRAGDRRHAGRTRHERDDFAGRQVLVSRRADLRGYRSRCGFLGNRSSGRMGFALAAATRRPAPGGHSSPGRSTSDYARRRRTSTCARPPTCTQRSCPDCRRMSTLARPRSPTGLRAKSLRGN